MVKAALIILLLAAMQGQSSKLVEHSATATVVEIDPAAYNVCLYHGHASGDITFNANYYDPVTHKPIGVLMDKGRYISYLWDPTVNSRPCLYFTRDGRAIIAIRPWEHHRKDMLVAVQGGPTLLGPAGPHEDMAEDTVRRTDQVSVGTTPAGKLYVAYTRRYSVRRIAGLFRSLGCDHAMKLDGGHSAHFTWGSLKLGNPNVICGVQFQRK